VLGTDNEMKSILFVKKDDPNIFVFSDYQKIFNNGYRTISNKLGLITAAWDGNLEKFKEEIAKGADIE